MFCKNSYLCIIEKNKNESDEHHAERGWFVVSQKPLTEKEYSNAVLYSNIHINKKYKGCTYSTDVENILRDMLENMIN